VIASEGGVILNFSVYLMVKSASLRLRKGTNKVVSAKLYGPTGRMVGTMAQLTKCSIAVPAEHTKSPWIAVSLKPKVSSHSSTPIRAITVPQLFTMYGSIIVHVINTEEFKGGFSTTGTLTPTVSLESCAFQSYAICFANCYLSSRTHGTQRLILSVALTPTVGTYC